MTGVDWNQAVTYCKWVKGVRLPTEQEWQFAAEGKQKREYPWDPKYGEPNDDLANFNMNIGSPSAVGLFPKGNTPEGVADMAGNVWEWTSSDHEDGGKSVRGGAYLDVASWLRAADRYGDVPVGRVGNLGFRLVREFVP